MIDIVIPLAKGGSPCNDLELKYALRSVEKHLSGFGKLVLVGHCPTFIRPEIHIPYRDGPKKQANIRGKIVAAMNHEGVSDPIFFMNDDHFLLQDAEAENYPFYHCGELTRIAEKGAKPLLAQLQALSLPSKHFDGHFPCLYEKEPFLAAIEAFTEEVIIKSSYGNFHRIEGTYCPDLKISSNLRKERIYEEIKDRPCFSVGDYGMSHSMKEVLQELYPNPSRWELQQAN